METKTPKNVVDLIKKEGIQMVDLRFMDFPGMWQHCSFPINEIDEGVFEKGLGFDSSSIRGWQPINESDMLMKPIPSTAFIDPFTQIKTLVMICDIWDPITGKEYSRDPRYVAQKAVKYVKSLGLADTVYFGTEAEFFIFDDVRYDQNCNESYYHIDSIEGKWNTGRVENPNSGYKIRHKEGYFPVPPNDSQQDLRSEMVINMQNIGIQIEAHHHEVATAGQAEIDMRFAPLVEMADNLLKFKYIIKNTAKKYGKTVTFMPKPLFGDNGSGMHVHVSLWKGGKNMFAGKGYAGLSEMAMFAIGGILKHAPALLAFTSPQPTVTRGWCRVMKRRSTLPTPSVTAAPLFVYPCIPRNPTPNAWNFAVPIHPVIHIWPLPLLLWLLWMEFKTKSILASLWIPIYTNCRRKKRPRFRQLLALCAML